MLLKPDFKTSSLLTPFLWTITVSLNSHYNRALDNILQLLLKKNNSPAAASQLLYCLCVTVPTGFNLPSLKPLWLPRKFPFFDFLKAKQSINNENKALLLAALQLPIPPPCHHTTRMISLTTFIQTQSQWYSVVFSLSTIPWKPLCVSPPLSTFDSPTWSAEAPKPLATTRCITDQYNRCITCHK